MNNTTISERLIVALDVPSGRQALELVAELEGSVRFFKVGLELIASGDGLKVIDRLADMGHHVFADFKLLDIPQTVYRSVNNLNRRGIRFLTVHADPQTMQAAVEAANGISILAVTVLTSLNDKTLQMTGIKMSTTALVKMRAKQAQIAGCAGVISSPREAQLIRENLGENFLIVTPGIRNSKSSDDQERTMGIDQALEAGSDFVVVGRPIRDAECPKQTALEYQAAIFDFEQSHQSAANVST